MDNHFDDEEHFNDVLFDIPMENIPINEKEMKEMKVEDKEWTFFQKNQWYIEGVNITGDNTDIDIV